MLIAGGADKSKAKQNYLSVRLAWVNIWTSVIDTFAEMVNLIFHFLGFFLIKYLFKHVYTAWG